MADPPALRKRRSRLHKADDHSICVPGRCPAVTPEDVGDVTRDKQQVKLGDAGSALWQEMTSSGELPPMQRVLLLEACRIADRLDRLDLKLRGEEREWLTLDERDDGRPVFVIVDKALSEARQQATALKSIVAELRQASAGTRAPGRPSAEEKAAEAQKTSGGAGGTLSDLTARIAARGGTSTS